MAKVMIRSEAETKRRKAVEFLQRIGRPEDAERFDVVPKEGRNASRDTACPGAGPDTDPCPASHSPPFPDALEQALRVAREAAGHLLAQFGTALDHAARLKVSRAFERVLITRDKRPRGRKRRKYITAAYEDWKAGIHGHQLYKKHIPGYSGMSRYRRPAAIKRLNDAILKRRRRDPGPQHEDGAASPDIV